MTDHNDMEDPQAGEVLPPMLLENWYAFCLESKSQGEHDAAFIHSVLKIGMEIAWKSLHPYLKAALPYFEAGVCDTRSGQADAGKLAELATFKEIANHES